MQQCCRAFIFFRPLEFREHTKKKKWNKKAIQKNIKKYAIEFAAITCSHDFIVPNEIIIDQRNLHEIDE